MKIYIIILALVFSHLTSEAQFACGTTFYIGSETTFYINGLVLKPSFNTSFVNKTFYVSSDAIPAASGNSISKVFTINQTLNFSGSVGIVYRDEDLNGNAETGIKMAYVSNSGNYLVASGSVVNENKHFVSSPIFATDLFKITAVSPTAAATPIMSVSSERSEGAITVKTLLYPNPVADKLSLETESWDKIEKVEIMNELGRAIFKLSDAQPVNGSTKIFNFTGLPSGIYLIKTTERNGLVNTAKVLKR